MTDIDKLARELAMMAFDTGCATTTHEQIRIDAARLGILEGIKLQRERDAVIVESVDLFDGDRIKNSDPRTTIAAAIRSAP